MSSAVAGEAMGPRPGIAIVSFWQGIAAVGLRIATLVLAVLAFITACVALGTINNMDEDIRDDYINEDEDDRSLVLPFTGVEPPNTPGIVGGSRGACGWIIFLCLAAFFYQPLVLLLRFLNFGLVNLKISIFLAVDIALSALFALGLLAGGISQGAWAAGWGQWQEFVDDVKDATLFPDVVDDYVEENNLYFGRVQGAMAACAAFSLLAIPVFGLLMLWMILFLVFKWNQKVVNYTIKDAVPGDPK